MQYKISAVITYGATRLIEAENQTTADRIAGESVPGDFGYIDKEGIVTRTVVTVVSPVSMEEDEEDNVRRNR